jgi:thioredoxin-like negative regulator of GroEL
MATSESTAQSTTGKRYNGWSLEIKLNTRRRQLIFLLAILIPAGVFVAQVVRITVAATLGESPNPARVQQAITLDPANPELHFNLGTLYLWEAAPNPTAALSEMRTATELNGNSAKYWSGLAKAAYAADDRPTADRAYVRAAELAPSRPVYAWEAALNYVTTGRPTEALIYLRHFVKLQPQRATEAYELLFRQYGDPDMLWNDLASTSRDIAVQLACLDYLSANGAVDFAVKHWVEITATRPDISLEKATPYMERLLKAPRYREAQTIWDYLESSGAISHARSDHTELIFNGGFEQEPTNVGFDWRHGSQPFIALNFEDRLTYSGARALRVDFTAPQNLEYEPLSQLVPVSPNQTYVLTAYARAEDLTSDSGPRLRVVDPRCYACLDATTEGLTGTSTWRRLQLQFTTSPTTEIVRVSLWRPRSRTFPMQISGRFWLDDVSLRPARIP